MVALFGANGAVGHALAPALDAHGIPYRAVGRNVTQLEILIVSQTGLSGEYTAILQRELAAVGIHATVKLFAPAAFNGPDGPLRTGRFNVAAQGWIGGADPEESVTFACSQIGPNGNNISRFCDRLPVIPMDYLRYFDAVNVRVSGFARNMLGFPVGAEDWDVR